MKRLSRTPRAAPGATPRRPPGVRRPKDRKATILAAAAELFAERGFAAVSVADIAERVGVTGGALYRHLPSKEALLDALVLEATDAFLAAADTAAAAAPPDEPEGALRRVVSDSVAAALDRAAPFATLVRERARLEAPARRALAHREARLFEIWIRAMRTARPSLDGPRVVVRCQAVNAALSALVLRPPALPRARLQALLCEAALAVLLAPIRARGTQIGAMPPAPRAWSPPRSRREDVLTAALRLFERRGFHGVGIDEIGETAGISGPAVYGYYASKADILVDAYERAASRVLVGAEQALNTATSAPDALARLVRSYVEVSSENVDLLVVTGREAHALPEAERPRISRRRRSFRDLWSSVVREIRPELSEAESRMLTDGVFPLVHEVVRRRRDQTPTLDEVADLAGAFLLGSREEPRDRT